jgi:polar amino acid transport system substrate-binding protein
VRCLILTLAIIAGSVRGPAAEPLELALTDKFPPYSDGRVSPEGMHFEIVNGALDRAGIPYEIIGYPWPRLVYATKANQLDGSFPWRAKPERFERFHMVGPFTDGGSRTVLWQHRNRPVIQWRGLPDLRNYMIGVVREFRYPDSFEQVRAELKTYEAVNERILLKMLALGRVDLVIGDERVLVAQARKANGISPDDFRRVGPALDTTRRYMAVPRARPEVASMLQQAIDAFKGTEAYARILAKYDK